MPDLVFYNYSIWIPSYLLSHDALLLFFDVFAVSGTSTYLISGNTRHLSVYHKNRHRNMWHDQVQLPHPFMTFLSGTKYWNNHKLRILFKTANVSMAQLKRIKIYELWESRSPSLPFIPERSMPACLQCSILVQNHSPQNNPRSQNLTLFFKPVNTFSFIMNWNHTNESHSAATMNEWLFWEVRERLPKPITFDIDIEMNRVQITYLSQIKADAYHILRK